MVLGIKLNTEGVYATFSILGFNFGTSLTSPLPSFSIGADISIYPNSPISNGFDLEVESGGYLNAAGLSIIGIGVGIFSSPISFTPASWLQFAEP